MIGMPSVTGPSMFGPHRVENLVNKLIDQKDSNKDGLLELDELKGREALLNKMDEDGDGQVSREELMNHLGNSTFNKIAAMVIRQKDTNEDDQLSQQELGAPTVLFDLIDANGDNQVNKSELADSMGKMMGKMRMGWPAKPGGPQGGGLDALFGSDDDDDDDDDQDTNLMDALDPISNMQEATQALSAYAQQMNDPGGRDRMYERLLNFVR